MLIILDKSLNQTRAPKAAKVQLPQDKASDLKSPPVSIRITARWRDVRATLKGQQCLKSDFGHE